MELNHTFTVPADRATAWAAFEDISSVAECFPGASVTSYEGDDFQGTCKVKLGPIALQYSGQGSFLERDAEAGRLVFDAKGRDKRGNGTAGAKVTATFHEEGVDSTRVDVHTDMQITGKPAQFGRGVMQDVSDKLLGQFVECLKQKVGAAPGQDASAEAAPQVDAAAAAPGATDVPAEPAPSAGPDAGATTGPVAGGAPKLSAVGGSSSRSTSQEASTSARASNNEPLDLGATVLPILLKSYGKQAAAVLGVLVVLRWLLGRRRG